MRTFACICYQKSHDIGDSTPEGRMLIKFIDELGTMIGVTSLLSGKTYNFPRIYIACHGIVGAEVDYIALHFGLEELV